ncbi:hypothetical protein [Kitasatospora sp. DSM 101779]|uniref:hypothetical protein n=1 Tax=Kitasatospora sp. DSM 101779 TaxID=2853165 RepID=UPI0021DA4766|nr:hypothetical protein [Kitasatospora sp. DSM 101779]MCU7825686.1 hypothetical protein [Kitasatospora sp. DSM 101779]
MDQRGQHPEGESGEVPRGPASHRRFGRRRMLLWLGISTAAVAVGGELARRALASGAAPAPPATAPPTGPAGASVGHAHAAPAPADPAPSPVDLTGRRWSDPAGWGGAVPGVESAVRIADRVLLDADASVGSLAVEPGGSLVFTPGRSLTLSSAGSVEVRGALVLAPEDGAVHTLRFPSVNERGFRGGGMTVMEGDTGLWVTGTGYLRLDGAAKTAWVRAATALRAGDTELRLAEPPTGWRAGDELAVTPTGPPSEDEFSTRYDLCTIRRIDGKTVTLAAPLAFAHPRVTAGGGVAIGAEVLNLTRSVRIEGTAEGRAHVHLTSSRRADVRHAALRWLGPRQPGKETWNGAPVTEPVLGRYGLHFHMLGDTSRGTVVEGVVVRDAGSHAFVPHASHGITFRSCISHNTWEDAYWWDGPTDTRTPQAPSDDIAYESCVASRTVYEPNPRGYRLTGFSLGAGTGGVARDCVAVGVQGATGASGYEWPEAGEGVWTFERCLAHNNLENGIFVWLNARQHHVLERFVAYHNGGWGIEHGAYLNDFDYNGGVLYGNAAGGVAVHALGREKGTVFDGLLIDAAGQSDYAIATVKHQLAGTTVTIARSRLTGYRKAGVAFRATTDGEPDDIAVLDCSFGGNEVWLDPEAPRPARVVLRKAGEREAVQLQPGPGKAEWNAAAAPTTVDGPPRAVVTPAIRLADTAAPTRRLPV